MPTNLQEEHLSDWIEVLDDMKLSSINQDGQKHYINPYKLMVVEARK